MEGSQTVKLLLLISAELLFVPLYEGEQRLVPQHWQGPHLELERNEVSAHGVDDCPRESVLLVE